MAAMTEIVPTPTRVTPLPPKSGATPVAVMSSWLRAQSINVTRHAAALRPFKADEFGTGAEAPTAGHLQAVNGLITQLRHNLLKMSRRVSKSARFAQEAGTAGLQDLMRKKEHAHHWVCLLYTSPSPRDMRRSRMPSSA